MQTLKVGVVSLLIVQAIFIVIFAFLAEYDVVDDNKMGWWMTQFSEYQDLHLMIFMGFGFLMTHIRRYAFSSMGFTVLIAAISVQWALITDGLLSSGKLIINVDRLIRADLNAASVVISFGALLGKISPLQLLVMALIQGLLCSVNYELGKNNFLVYYGGDTLYVSVFGAYFGLAASFFISRGVEFTKKDKELKSSTYFSNITAMIGTLILWVSWPTFNSALVGEWLRHLALVNTVLALASSCVASYCISVLLNKHGKYNLDHIQNATIAGGVCVGAAAGLFVQPYGALLIGSFAGILSSIGYIYIQDFLEKKLGLHDTCGVHNVHGMPGLAGGLISAIVALVAHKTKLGEEFEFSNVPDAERSSQMQAGYQLLSLVVTLILAVVGGSISGLVLSKLPLGKIPPGKFYDDAYLWDFEEGSIEEADSNELPEAIVDIKMDEKKP